MEGVTASQLKSSGSELAHATSLNTVTSHSKSTIIAITILITMMLKEATKTKTANYILFCCYHFINDRHSFL